jgi:methylenetetrahydrofolate reductase (NADPH)
MGLLELWRNGNRATISFELFPQRDPVKARKLEKKLDDFKALNPDFISVTFGAGGTTRDGSLDLVRKLQPGDDIQVLPYFACYGLGPEQIKGVLDSYLEEGVRSVLCVRGDEPRQESGFQKHPDSFDHADRLIQFVSRNYHFALGAAGYPEVHREAAGLDEDIGYLKKKVDAGARFIITQYFFDNDYYFRFRDHCRAAGIETPIIAGIMPIFNVKVLKNLSQLCGASITYDLQEGLDAIDTGDRREVHRFGVSYAVQQCADLIRKGVDGIHFYTMDRVKSVREILQRLQGGGLLPKQH